jgi:RNA polymerase sigma-70 factor (ECF subfamily)
MDTTATAHPRMTAPELDVESRRLYDGAHERAMGFAERYLPRAQALEIAHDVAIEIHRLPSDRVTGTLIWIAVTSRLRNFWRATQRRAAAEGAYHEMWAGATSTWAQPGAEMEARELQTRIEAAVAAMPPAMRDVFVLVRGRELSYREAAARLGVSVGTVHTQLSRANALLRECVARYHADSTAPNHSRRARQP